MIGFSIMMWFISVILVILSISLLKGNYSSVHGKVFDAADDKEGYAKELGKPTLLIGIGIFISGIIAVVIRQEYSIIIAVGFLLLVVIIAGIWFYKVQKRFS
jgi:dipeptide/tripeptide permease